MVIKILIALLLCCSSALAGTKDIRDVIGMAIPAGGSCSATPVYTESAETSNIQITAATNAAYAGGYWTGTGFTLCKAAVRMRKWLGDTTAKSYVVSVYSPDGTAIGELKGSSDTLTGYNSTTISSVEFTFSTPVAVATGDIIVFSEVSPSVDTSNYLRIYFTTADSDFDYGLWGTNLSRSTTSDIISPSFILYPYE